MQKNSKKYRPKVKTENERFKYFNVITFYYKMVSITLAIPEEVKRKMERFREVNWSGFIRRKIIEKTDELSWKEKMLKKLEEEKEITEWAVNLQRRAREKRYKELKSKGLI